MLLFLLAVITGLALLVWSAERFVEGSASLADHFGLPPLLIGMVIVGFGTSAPEMAVSALASLEGNPDLAIGNAYGSNITNIALILGLTALISPIKVESKILRKELPVLAAITALAAFQIRDGYLSGMDALVLLGVFAGMLTLTVVAGLYKKNDPLADEIDLELDIHAMPLSRSLFFLGIGLVLLVLSSRMLVWGAVGIAAELGVSSLVIGLTVVAVGTSLPELATSVVATRKGEHDIALGNVLGSNIFNTLMVVGLAGVIQPFAIQPEVFLRDIPVMALLTVLLFIFGFGFRQQGRINRVKGAVLLGCYIAYTVYLVVGSFQHG
ncbi:MAG: calcium:proton antiporter [Pelodictyon luteolum]|uniref:Calcium:proton antiporter n=1 Tax=Pelodictyon luteolum TaxID=1100 RepID=A0A165MDI9_PELLU|nr:calcium/sodium antiporter [Pelodictyon luteolum]KZK75116.1 MAG: calcium:proton antiporter [Pelodictyon luteolum]